MTRSLRIEYPGAWYHVMNRGAGRARVFDGEAPCRKFLELLGEVDEVFAVETHAYCLMGTHYHLLLHTPRGNLGRAMRHLGGVFTQWANRRAQSDGPLFRGRYKAIVVDGDSYLLQVGRYIHLNPVTAGLARRPEAYPWSSYGAYLGAVEASAWLHMEPTLALLDGDRDGYRAFVDQGLDQETAAFYQRRGLAPVMGQERFRQGLAARQAAAGEESSYLRLSPPTMAQIIEATGDAFDRPPEDLRVATRGRGRRQEARSVAISLCRSLAGHPLGAIAEAFGLTHHASASNAARRGARMIAEDPVLARKVARIKAQLHGGKTI